MGLLVVDELEVVWPLDSIRIKAKAATQTATKACAQMLQTHKTRSWPAGTTLDAMARTIASEHRLQSAMSTAFISITLPHIR